jgi:hypothetical protein
MRRLLCMPLDCVDAQPGAQPGAIATPHRSNVGAIQPIQPIGGIINARSSLDPLALL